MGETHVRTRPQDSDRVKSIFSSQTRKKNLNFDKNSFKWLAENYTRKNILGLRNWTWKTIMEGIRNEHLYYIKEQGDDAEVDA